MSVAGSLASGGDQGSTFDQIFVTMFSVRERIKKNLLMFSFLDGFAQCPLVYEVCNVSFENVLVALEHAQRSVLDLAQGYLFLCNTGAKA